MNKSVNNFILSFEKCFAANKAFFLFDNKISSFFERSFIKLIIFLEVFLLGSITNPQSYLLIKFETADCFDDIHGAASTTFNQIWTK